MIPTGSDSARFDSIRGLDATSTAADTLAGIDLTGRTVVVTGAASGIGVETARALADAGADVTLAVRDTAAGERVAADLRTSARGEVTVRELHLDDLGSVRAFTDAWSGGLDVLVNNAGVMTPPETYTAAGWELQFATNHLGHMALTLGLHEALRASGRGRVVSVSSSGNASSPVVFDDLFFRRRPYDAGEAYGQSKTANVLLAVGITARWAADGITSNACMPGGVWTSLQKHWDPEVLAQTKQAAGDAVKSPAQGAATSVLLATAPELDGVGGRYFEDCHEAQTDPPTWDGVHGVRSWALDPAQADRLWDVSTALIDAELRRLGH